MTTQTQQTENTDTSQHTDPESGPRKIYTMYADPGHAWLKVRRAELVRLGILEQISRYSYQHGPFVFLEEDCDAARFVIAKSQRGEGYMITEECEPRADRFVRRCARFSRID